MPTFCHILQQGCVWLQGRRLGKFSTVVVIWKRKRTPPPAGQYGGWTNRFSLSPFVDLRFVVSQKVQQGSKHALLLRQHRLRSSVCLKMSFWSLPRTWHEVRRTWPLPMWSRRQGKAQIISYLGSVWAINEENPNAADLIWMVHLGMRDQLLARVHVRWH